MLRFMYHNLLDCGTKTLDWTKNFIEQSGLHPKLRKSYFSSLPFFPIPSEAGN